MRSIRLLVFVVAFASVVPMYLASGAAATTVLCEIKPVEIEDGEGGSESFLGCPEGAKYGTDLSGADTISGSLVADSPQKEGETPSAIMQSASGNITCTESGFKAGVKSAGTEGETTSLTFASCTTTISSCSVTSVTSSPSFSTTAAYESLGASGPNGTLTITNPKTSVALSCAAGTLKPTCIYDGGTVEKPYLLTGDYYNVENENAPSEEWGGIMDLNDTIVLTKSEGSGTEICPEEATLRATYATKGESSITGQVGQAREATLTKLCKTKPAVKGAKGHEYLECGAGEGFSGAVTGGLVTNQVATFTALIEEQKEKTPRVITCKEVVLAGEFNEDGSSKTGLTQLKYQDPGKTKCPSSLKNNPEVTIEMKNLPYDSSYVIYVRKSIAEGQLVLAGTNGNPRLQVEVEGEKCLYSERYVTTDFTNATTTTSILAMTLNWDGEKGNGGKCPERLNSFAYLTMTRAGGNVYVAKK